MKKLIFITLPVLILAACSNSKEDKGSSGAVNYNKPLMDTLLTRFDSLDFDVYSNQRWSDLHVSHSDDIIVHYPDGHITKGLDAHLEEIKPQFVFAPNTKITSHPIKIAAPDFSSRSGEWTSVIGVIEGDFTRPMPIGGGKSIPATGKHFKFQAVTVAHWKNGKMDEEYLFWDNLDFMKQVGVAN
jgi:SnoaL-like polyketide cyclase